MSAHSSSSAGTWIQRHHQTPPTLPTNTKGTSQSTCILFKFERNTSELEVSLVEDSNTSPAETLHWLITQQSPAITHNVKISSYYHQTPPTLPTNTKGTSQSTCILFKFEENTPELVVSLCEDSNTSPAETLTESSTNQPSPAITHNGKISTSLIVEQNATNLVTVCITSIYNSLISKIKSSDMIDAHDGNEVKGAAAESLPD